MLLQSIISLLAGIGVFIIGMNLMSSNLQRITSEGLKKMIGKITNKKFSGIMIGATVTALIHSSAATTIMVIGFVNAGAMSLLQATPVIMGANIGTTITGLIVSLSSFDITVYFGIFVFIGVIMMFFKKDKIKSIGGIISGTGLLFIGLSLMSEAFKAPEITDFLSNLFLKIDFPLLLLLIGVVFTALLQSSGAMTGLIIVMAGSGVLAINDALFIILGANIGTCVITLISAISTNTNAKRAAIIHLLFNVIGVLVFTVFLWIFNKPIVNLLGKINSPAFEIAVFHIVFNLSTTLILLPFTKQIVKLSELIIKDKKKPIAASIKYIDEHLFVTPAIAVYQVEKEILNMALTTKANLVRSVNALTSKSLKDADLVYEEEAKIDYMNRTITAYLIKLSPLVDATNSNKVGSFFHVVNDIERIGDHAENFMDAAKEMNDKGISFSKEATLEIKEMFNNIVKMYDISLKSFFKADDMDLSELSRLEANVDRLKQQYSISHFERLSQTNCTMELGAYFTSIIASLERVGDHLVNIGYSIKNPTGSQVKGE